MRAFLTFCLVLSFIVLLGSCTDTASVGGSIGVGAGDVEALDDFGAERTVDSESGGSQSPIQVWDAGASELTDSGESSDAGSSGGEFGDPCSENQDCESGLCVEDYNGSVCTDFCVDQCPSGWACKDVSGSGPDVIYACVPTAVDLCKPCDQNTDCGGSSDVCARLDFEVEFGYCAASCAQDIDCPNEFSCIEAESMEGASHMQCVPADGDCGCPPGALVGSPGCEEVIDDQDGDGIPDEEDNCPTHDNPGQENTDGDEWGDACDPDDDNDGDQDPTDCAPLDPEIYTGAEEICDGIDNNCNGEVDEGFADSDSDGTADCTDADDDNDTSLDEEDCEPLNPLIFAGAEEICDGIDNNCNDEIDEGFEDVDEDGILDCLDDDSDNDGDPDPSDCAPFDPAINNAAEEICDGIDNDCDTLVDEGYPDFDSDDGADCVDEDDDDDGDPDTEDCEPFNPDVYHGALDLCDGFDNDCDDVIDPGYEGVGNSCDGDDDDFCGNGTLTCSLDGLTLVCVNETLVNISEVCNGNDDDCDGEIDEDFPLVDTACDGEDADSCANGVFACDPGSADLVCVESAGNVEEICNDFDDDCDGQVDEGFATIQELCNGIDDNCDGFADETFQQLGEACDGSDLDSCALGTFTCSPDGLGLQCVNEQNVSTIEACNGLDDDCDGQTDEEFANLGQACDGDDSDQCANGVLSCDPTGNGTFCANESPAGIAEVCNGLDDDCDGQVDEDFANLGQACDGDDSDQCANGTNACDPTGNGTFCANESPTGISEVCNGLDDDCDGQVDEGFANLGQACDGDDSDQCANGSIACNPAGDGTFCANESISGITEVCNGFDDDCDGEVDEDFATLGQACDGDDSDQCENGIIACDATGNGVFCGNEPPAGISELCNGVDDDCDGQADENFGTLGQACDGNDSDQCANGIITCDPTGNGVICGDESSVGIVEICNGFDDDCDGQVDEGFTNLGQTCDGDDADLCGSGSWTCTADGLSTECVNETQEPIAEICNGQDEDCDTLIDEDFPELGETCDGDDSDSCANGTFVCAPDTSGVVCAETVENIVESCNGLDDDCDGEIDEDACLSIGGVPVEPYTGNDTVQNWYSYNFPVGSSANAELSISNKAIVYFYEDGAGKLSMVVTLDKPDDGTGGAVFLQISGATGMAILVSDDGGEAQLNSGTGTGDGIFNWIECCTDGFVVGHWTSSSCITLTVSSATNIDSWVVLSGDGSQQVIAGSFVGSTLEVCGEP